MAYIDLSTYDILDLIPSSSFSDEMKGEWLYQFVTAYGGYLAECLGSKVKEEDQTDFEILLDDEDVTPEEIENFFREKISGFDDFQTGVALKFKKDYLLTFYHRMEKVMTEKNHFSVPLWAEIIKDAEEDNWETVFTKIREMEMKDQEISQKAPVSPATIPPVAPIQDNTTPPVTP